MAVKTLTAGKNLHEKGRDTVSTVEVLVKGKVKIDNGLLTLTASTGAILGIGEKPGMSYAFTYTATEDCQLVPYTYNSMDDIAAVIAENPKAVEQYKSGQTKITGFFVGQTMKRLKGKADPAAVNAVLAEALKKL